MLREKPRSNSSTETLPPHCSGVIEDMLKSLAHACYKRYEHYVHSARTITSYSANFWRASGISTDCRPPPATLAQQKRLLQAATKIHGLLKCLTTKVRCFDTTSASCRSTKKYFCIAPVKAVVADGGRLLITGHLLWGTDLPQRTQRSQRVCKESLFYSSSVNSVCSVVKELSVGVRQMGWHALSLSEGRGDRRS